MTNQKIQIISPPNDQLAGLYLSNSLAEQWRSVIRLVYPVGVSRDFNLIPIPGTNNNDSVWDECIKSNSYLLYPHRKKLTTADFYQEFRAFCEKFNDIFTNTMRAVFPWDAIDTREYIRNMAFSVTRGGRVTAIDFVEIGGYMDADAIKKTEHFLSLTGADCRIIATDISSIMPVKDGNPMIITFANKDNYKDIIAELNDFIRRYMGYEPLSIATNKIFKDEVISNKIGGAWKIEIGPKISKNIKETKNSMRIYDTPGVLFGRENVAGDFTMPDDVMNQWSTIMKTAYPAIIPSAARLLKLVGNPDCESKYDESILKDSYVLIPEDEIGGLYCTQILGAINAKLLRKSNANESIDIPWTCVVSQANTILVGISRPYQVCCFDLHDIRSDDESKNEIRRFFNLICSDSCEMTVVNIGSLIDTDDVRRPLIITLATNDNSAKVLDELENFMKVKTGRDVQASSMGAIFGYENGSWRLDVGKVIEKETEENDDMEKSIKQLFMEGKDIPAGVADQWKSILQRVYNDTRTTMENFYLIPLTKREDYAGPAYHNDMLNHSYLLSPDATFNATLYYNIHQKLMCGETTTKTKGLPWSYYAQDKTLSISMSTDSEVTYVRPAVTLESCRKDAEEGFEQFSQLVNREGCIVTACDVSFISESLKGYRPMIVTFTRNESAIEVINDLTDFISATTGLLIDTLVPTEDGAMIANFKKEGEADMNCRIAGPRGLTSKAIKIYTVSVKLTAMNTPPVSVKLDVVAENEEEALEVAKQQLKLYFKNDSIPVYPKVIAESVYDLVSERPILDK